MANTSNFYSFFVLTKQQHHLDDQCLLLLYQNMLLVLCPIFAIRLNVYIQPSQSTIQFQMAISIRKSVVPFLLELRLLANDQLCHVLRFLVIFYHPNALLSHFLLKAIINENTYVYEKFNNNLITSSVYNYMKIINFSICHRFTIFFSTTM